MIRRFADMACPFTGGTPDNRTPATGIFYAKLGKSKQPISALGWEHEAPASRLYIGRTRLRRGMASFVHVRRRALAQRESQVRAQWSLRGLKRVGTKIYAGSSALSPARCVAR